MSGTEISVILWGLTTMGSLAALFFKLKSDVRHLEDTKESKNGLATAVDALTIAVRLSTQKLEEHEKKIETIFDKVPCFKPGWNKDDC